MQRDPDIYDNPLEFKPKRFLDSPNGGGKLKSGIYYAPFGDGPRNCIGEYLNIYRICGMNIKFFKPLWA